MPRYRFNVYNDDQTVDVEGSLFPDRAAARVYAIGCARSIMAEELKTKGAINLKHWIEVKDDEGEVDVVAFGEAVTVRS